MPGIRFARDVCLMFVLVLLAASCGSAMESAAQHVRASYAQLELDASKRNAGGMCAGLFVYGEHQPHSALIATLRGSTAPQGRESVRRQIAQCTADFETHPRDLAAYATALRGTHIAAVQITGQIATLRISPPSRSGGQLRMVDIAGRWRLLTGVS